MAAPTGTKAARARERERIRRVAAATSVPAGADVCVIGCGAAGVVAATAAAEAGASVVALDRGTECARTILATGNGRCNFANADLSPEHYNCPRFVSTVMGDEPLADVLSWFGECGLAWCEQDGRLYPRSLSAASVRDVLLARATASGAILAPMREVVSVTPLAGGGFEVAFRELFHAGADRADRGDRTDRGDVTIRTLTCRSVVIASGGGLGGALEGLALRTVPERPVLCPLACAMGPLVALDGRRATCEMTLLRDGKAIAREAGELLFRSYGVSGIAAFNLSRVAEAGDELCVDLLPELSGDEVEAMLRAPRDLATSLHGMLDPAIAEVLLGMGPRDPKGIANLAKGFEVRVDGPADVTHAQVTRGGLANDRFDAETLESLDAPGVFACGEALDVDGACGGYNLAWAWLSGRVAGEAAARETESSNR